MAAAFSTSAEQRAGVRTAKYAPNVGRCMMCTLLWTRVQQIETIQICLFIFGVEQVSFGSADVLTREAFIGEGQVLCAFAKNVCFVHGISASAS